MENNQIQEQQIQQEQVQEVQVPEQKPEEKRFTQDEVNKMIEKRLAREKKDLAAQIEREREESAKLAKMSESERQKAILEKQMKEFEEMKAAFEKEKLLNETSKQLAQNNLPVEFAEYLITKDAESTFNNINTFKEKWNAALEAALDERMKGKSPAAAPLTNKQTLTMADVRNMSTTEVQARWAEVQEAMKRGI